MASLFRSTSYTCEEDEHLCHLYMDVSQDLIKSNNQTKKQLWARVVQEYNSKRPPTIVGKRNPRSVEDRMQAILKAMIKLRGCIRKVEKRNQSGISEKDIMIQAKQLMMLVKNYKKGFKFDHVWPILKDLETFAAHDGDSSSHSETPDSSSLGLPSLSINLSDDSTGATTSKRPCAGIKKAKFNNAQNNETRMYVEALANKTIELTDVLNRRQDFKIMMTDLNSITDPETRAYLLAERARVRQKNAEQSNQDHNTTDEFSNQYYNTNDGFNNQYNTTYGFGNQDYGTTGGFSQLFGDLDPAGPNISDY